jgi:AcrR family transcriptional regulator
MGRKRTFAEAEVLEMARDLFWATGYDGTSTYDLMESTGLGKGSLYKAFGNKHDLYMRVFSDYCRQLVAAAREALQDTNLPSLSRIEHYLVSVAESFGTESPRRGCFLTKATVDLAGLDKAVADTARRAYSDIAAAFAASVRTAQSSGEIDGNADPDALGYLLVAVVRGIDCLAKAGVDSDILTSTARNAVAVLPRPRTPERPRPFVPSPME